MIGPAGGLSISQVDCTNCGPCVAACPVNALSETNGIQRVWDAINDPLVGTWSDNTRTRWGRRRPFITVGALLLVVGISLLLCTVITWMVLEKKGTIVERMKGE